MPKVQIKRGTPYETPTIVDRGSIFSALGGVAKQEIGLAEIEHASQAILDDLDKATRSVRVVLAEVREMRAADFSISA